ADSNHGDRTQNNRQHQPAACGDNIKHEKFLLLSITKRCLAQPRIYTKCRFLNHQPSTATATRCGRYIITSFKENHAALQILPRLHTTKIVSAPAPAQNFKCY